MRRSAVSPRRRTWLRELFDRIDPEPVIAALEDLATPARCERLRHVFDQRIESVTVVMDAPHDPHNGAAVLRSCDAFGVYRIHVVERSEPFCASGAVAKGTERWVDAVSHPTAADAIARLRHEGYRLVGTHPEGELTPQALRNVERLALVMGNEHDGICEELNAACEARVRVPMRGFVESLNVSVTAAILLSQAAGDRPGDLPPERRRQLYARGLLMSVPRALDVLEARGIHLPEADARDLAVDDPIE
ncbi:MAG: RNA methyltransferase [Polyangiaceae bacterium]